jgi:hypothetical protein
MPDFDKVFAFIRAMKLYEMKMNTVRPMDKVDAERLRIKHPHVEK